MVTIGTCEDLGLSPTNTALCCNESQGRHRSPSNASTVTGLGIFVVLGFFSDEFNVPHPFFLCSWGRFSRCFLSNQMVLQSQCAGSPWVKWFSLFQILCRPDLNLTVFV